MAGPRCILAVLVMLLCHSVGVIYCQLFFSQQMYSAEEDTVNSVVVCYQYFLEVLDHNSTLLEAHIFTSDGTAIGKVN